jgi:hypothetical protein
MELYGAPTARKVVTVIFAYLLTSIIPTRAAAARHGFVWQFRDSGATSPRARIRHLEQRPAMFRWHAVGETFTFLGIFPEFRRIAHSMFPYLDNLQVPTWNRFAMFPRRALLMET